MEQTEHPKYYNESDTKWYSLAEAKTILDKVLKNRKEANQGAYEFPPTVQLFYEYFKNFADKDKLDVQYMTQKVFEITGKCERMPEREAKALWNLAPENPDEARAMIRELEKYDDSVIKSLIDLFKDQQ